MVHCLRRDFDLFFCLYSSRLGVSGMFFLQPWKVFITSLTNNNIKYDLTGSKLQQKFPSSQANLMFQRRNERSVEVVFEIDPGG